jgi:hypothetical protein
MPSKKKPAPKPMKTTEQLIRESHELRDLAKDLAARVAKLAREIAERDAGKT